MKKFLLSILVISFIFCQNVYADNRQSQNTFQININDVPANVQTNDSKSGLSDGAVTAIALGSTFGGLGILTGIGYYFYKNSKDLQAGLICGKKCPYQTVNSKTFCEILANKKEYTYLMKASTKSDVNKNYYYLIIPDTDIKTRTFNTVFFELPNTFNSEINFRIIQASKPFKLQKNIPQLDSDIFINPKSADVKKIPTYTKELNPDGGFLVKSGKIQNSSSNILTLTTQNLSNKENQIYAIIVEFWVSD